MSFDACFRNGRRLRQERWRTCDFRWEQRRTGLTSSAFGDDQGDVVGLFIRAESSGLICNCFHQLRRGQLSMLPRGFEQTFFPKFLSLATQSFRHTVGIKQNGVAWSQFAFFHRTIPFLEQAHHRAGCLQPFQTVVSAYEQARWMATVGVAQLARIVVVLGEEEARVISLIRVFVEQLIDRSQ